ncbi:MAG: 50S ribosomal protein L28 [Alphaproteobacteria bacterium]|nr:50S ribosomal protein L28 [Alphaproteobacteria bacterium]
MAKRGPITGKGVQAGNTVSHAKNATRRRFMPNLQNVSLMSEILGNLVHFRISANGLRTIEHNGGLDNYLLSTPNSRLTEEAKEIKKRILKAKKSN